MMHFPRNDTRWTGVLLNDNSNVCSKTTDYWGCLSSCRASALSASRQYTIDRNNTDVSKMKAGTDIYELFDELERLKKL
jgi:hypothetical protein